MKLGKGTRRLAHCAAAQNFQLGFFPSKGDFSKTIIRGLVTEKQLSRDRGRLALTRLFLALGTGWKLHPAAHMQPPPVWLGPWQVCVGDVPSHVPMMSPWHAAAETSGGEGKGERAAWGQVLAQCGLETRNHCRLVGVGVVWVSFC